MERSGFSAALSEMEHKTALLVALSGSRPSFGIGGHPVVSACRGSDPVPGFLASRRATLAYTDVDALVIRAVSGSPIIEGRSRTLLHDLRAVYLIDHMPSNTHVAKWGNSLAVRIPRAIVTKARLAEGDRLSFILVADGSIVMRSRHPRYSLEQLVAAIRPGNRHRETDWGAPRGKEVW
jgi:antitoxin MazE